jgi:hypothetical protein
MRYAIALAHHRMAKRASNREITDPQIASFAINLVESHASVECRSSTAIRYVGDSSVLSGKRHTLSSLVPIQKVKTASTTAHRLLRHRHSRGRVDFVGTGGSLRTPRNRSSPTRANRCSLVVRNAFDQDLFFRLNTLFLVVEDSSAEVS